MKRDLEKVRKLASDLRNQEPRPAHQELAGLPMAARTLDKCRASLVGLEGDFRFGCPMDQEFFTEAGVKQREFEEIVATGATDAEVEKWLEEHAVSQRG